MTKQPTKEEQETEVSEWIKSLISKATQDLQKQLQEAGKQIELMNIEMLKLEKQLQKKDKEIEELKNTKCSMPHSQHECCIQLKEKNSLYEALEEENSYLKSKLLQTEQTSSEISSTQQNLLELLIDSGVI